MRNCIVIGYGAETAPETLNASNALLIGTYDLPADGNLPDNYVSVGHVHTGVIEDERWPAAMLEAQHNIKLLGAPEAIAQLVEPFGIDPEAARAATIAAIGPLLDRPDLRDEGRSA